MYCSELRIIFLTLIAKFKGNHQTRPELSALYSKSVNDTIIHKIWYSRLKLLVFHWLKWLLLSNFLILIFLLDWINIPLNSTIFLLNLGVRKIQLSALPQNGWKTSLSQLLLHLRTCIPPPPLLPLALRAPEAPRRPPAPPMFPFGV